MSLRSAPERIYVICSQIHVDVPIEYPSGTLFSVLVQHAHVIPKILRVLTEPIAFAHFACHSWIACELNARQRTMRFLPWCYPCDELIDIGWACPGRLIRLCYVRKLIEGVQTTSEITVFAICPSILLSSRRDLEVALVESLAQLLDLHGKFVLLGLHQLCVLGRHSSILADSLYEAVKILHGTGVRNRNIKPTFEEPAHSLDDGPRNSIARAQFDCARDGRHLPGRVPRRSSISLFSLAMQSIFLLLSLQEFHRTAQRTGNTAIKYSFSRRPGVDDNKLVPHSGPRDSSGERAGSEETMCKTIRRAIQVHGYHERPDIAWRHGMARGQRRVQHINGLRKNDERCRNTDAVAGELPNDLSPVRIHLRAGGGRNNHGTVALRIGDRIDEIYDLVDMHNLRRPRQSSSPIDDFDIVQDFTNDVRRGNGVKRIPPAHRLCSALNDEVGLLAIPEVKGEQRDLERPMTISIREPVETPPITGLSIIAFDHIDAELFVEGMRTLAVPCVDNRTVELLS